MSGAFAGGDLDRSDTGVGGERVFCREPRGSSGAADQPDGGDRPDPVDLAETGAVVVESDAHSLLDGHQRSVHGPQVAQRILGELLAGPLTQRYRADRAQQHRC